MALKHLTLAAELLRGGMPISDIAAIIKMQDVPAEEQQENSLPETDEAVANPDQDQHEDPTGQESSQNVTLQDKPAEQPVKKTEPLNRAEPNHEGGQALVEELNKLF